MLDAIGRTFVPDACARCVPGSRTVNAVDTKLLRDAGDGPNLRAGGTLLELGRLGVMPSEGVWVLAGVVASGTVTIATERLRHRWQQEVRRDDQDRIRTQALADARRSAYARYLVVQHEVETLFRALPPSERDSVAQALDEHYRSRRSSPDLSVWLESAAAEMHARLLAGERVLRAIDDFEEFIRNALAARLMRQHSDLAPEEWDSPWEEQRRILIEAMRDEQQADFADPRGIS